MNTAYQVPADRAWIPVKVISVEITKREKLVRRDRAFRETEIDFYDIQAVHAESTYGKRPHPYRMFIPVEDVWYPKRNATSPDDAFQVTSGADFRCAVGTDDLAKMPGAVVMGQIRLVTRQGVGGGDVVFDTLMDWVKPVPERRIDLLTQQGMLSGLVTWGSIGALLVEEVTEGSIAKVMTERGDFLDICWINGRWEELTADVRSLAREQE